MRRLPGPARWACALLLFGALTATGAEPPRNPPPAVRFGVADSASRTLAVTDEAGARQVPFAGFSVRQIPAREWTIVTFYVMYREVAEGDARRRESYWIARRATGNDADRTHTPVTIDWASSGKCPALDGMIRTMGEEISDRLEIAVPGEGDPSEIPVGVIRYALWSGEARFRGTGYGAVLHLTADAGSPLALWVDGNASALAPCWGDVDPPAIASAAR